MWQYSSAICHKHVTTDSKAPWLRIRKASRVRAPDSPMPGEYMEVRTARSDGKYPTERWHPRRRNSRSRAREAGDYRSK